MAAELGDVAALQALSAAFDRSPENARWSVSAGQPYMVLTNDGTVVIPAYHLARVMLARANEKNHADVLKILDDHLDSRRIADPAARRARASNSTQVDVTRITYPIFSSQTASRLYSLDFPAPSPYLDGGSILLLRNAFALFQRDGILANLIDDSRRRADAKPGDPSTRLALSALLWWSEDKSGALRELERAIALAPGGRGAEVDAGGTEVAAERVRRGARGGGCDRDGRSGPHAEAGASGPPAGGRDEAARAGEAGGRAAVRAQAGGADAPHPRRPDASTRPPRPGRRRPRPRPVAAPATTPIRSPA